MAEIAYSTFFLNCVQSGFIIHEFQKQILQNAGYEKKAVNQMGSELTAVLHTLS